LVIQRRIIRLTIACVTPSRVAPLRSAAAAPATRRLVNHIHLSLMLRGDAECPAN
jgi:hypothetical protein